MTQTSGQSLLGDLPPSPQPSERPLLGESLVDSIEVPQVKFDLLFSAMLVTSLSVFLLGNLLVLFNLEIFKYSLAITIACLEILAVFYFISRSQGSPVTGLAVTYVLVWGIALTHRFGLSIVFHALALFSMAYTIWFLRVKRESFPAVTAMGVVGSLAVLGTGRVYTSFCIIPKLHLGWVHPDTLFLSSIAAMIKNYGVQSTGLHGLIEINYHTFSIALFGAISGLSGQGVLECYGVANWVLFVPIAIFSIVFFVAMLDRGDRVNLPILWMLLCLMLIMIPVLFSRWSLDFFFTAESQTVGIGLLLLGSALLFKRNFDIKDLILAVLISYMLGQTKGPMGIMWAILWLSRAIFIHTPGRYIGIVTTLLVFVAVFASTVGTVKSSGDSILLSPFNHIVKYAYGGDRLGDALDALRTSGILNLQEVVSMVSVISCFFMIHYLFSWVLLQRLFWRRGVLGILKSPIGVYCLALTSASSGVIILFRVGMGNEGNFSLCAFFIALPVFLAAIVDSRSRWFAGSGAMILIGAGISLVILGLSYPNFHEKSYFSVSWHYFKGKRSPLVDELIGIRERSEFAEILEVSPQMKTMNPLGYCVSRPFVFPSVSERPWIGVLTDIEAGCQYKAYGYADYGIESSSDQVPVSVMGLEGMTVRPATP
jgi:hypothetical protein